jgi:hypothetical protein
MGNGIRGAAAAASREIFSQSVGSSSFQVRKRKFSRGEAVATVFDAAERRASALDESIDRVLTNAGVRAAEYFKLTWPKLSAATLNPLTNVIPLLLGISAFATMLKMPSMIALSILAVMPAAFRIWIVAHSRAESADSIPGHLSTTPVEDLPVYSIIVPLRSEARVVDQLLSAIERLDYPGIMAQTPQA